MTVSTKGIKSKVSSVREKPKSTSKKVDKSTSKKVEKEKITVYITSEVAELLFAYAYQERKKVSHAAEEILKGFLETRVKKEFLRVPEPYVIAVDVRDKEPQEAPRTFKLAQK